MESIALAIINRWGPKGFWGSGEKGYLFSGSWGALVIIFRDLRSKLTVLGIRFRDSGSPAKKKKTPKRQNTFRELKSFLSGIWGGHCIFFRDQGSTDLPLGASSVD